MSTARFQFEFVEFIPASLKPGRVYISVEYATASHLCACGCEQLVVTPLTPNDWRLTYDGETVSLSPSIGNWSFDCQSHYIIRRGSVDWAPQWSRSRIDRGRAADRASKDGTQHPPNDDAGGDDGVEAHRSLAVKTPPLWQRLLERVGVRIRR